MLGLADKGWISEGSERYKVLETNRSDTKKTDILGDFSNTFLFLATTILILPLKDERLTRVSPHLAVRSQAGQASVTKMWSDDQQGPCGFRKCQAVFTGWAFAPTSPPRCTGYSPKEPSGCKKMQVCLGQLSWYPNLSVRSTRISHWLKCMYSVLKIIYHRIMQLFFLKTWKLLRKQPRIVQFKLWLVNICITPTLKKKNNNRLYKPLAFSTSTYHSGKHR